jgi:HEAT repeat protein
VDGVWDSSGETFKESTGSERVKIMLKMKPLTQHVQESSERVSSAEISQHQWCQKRLSVLLHHVFAAVKSSSSRWSKEQATPAPMTMPDLLAGRFLVDVSQYSSLPDDNKAEPSSIEDTSLADQRAKLFAQLGIRSEKANAPGEIEKLIATLSHIDVKERIDAAHTIANLYVNLSAEKQMHARINLILMTWRDVDAYARIAAIKALGSTKAPDVSEALQVALRDEEREVRAAAARALGGIRGKAAVVALVAAAIREDEHWSVRAAAIRAMGESGERTFLNTINLALDNEDDSMRIAAIFALAQLEGRQAVPRLALIAQRDKQPHVRHAAILELEDLRSGDDKRHT